MNGVQDPKSPPAVSSLPTREVLPNRPAEGGHPIDSTTRQNYTSEGVGINNFQIPPESSIDQVRQKIKALKSDPPQSSSLPYETINTTSTPLQPHGLTKQDLLDRAIKNRR